MLCCSMFFFFKQKTAYEMRISDWSSDVCSSDLCIGGRDVHFVSVGQPSRVFDGARLVALAGRGVKGPALRFAARYEPKGAAGQAGGGGPRHAVYAVCFAAHGFTSRWMTAGGASRFDGSAGVGRPARQGGVEGKSVG